MTQHDWHQTKAERGKRNTRKRYDRVRKIKEASPCADCQVYYPFWVMQFDHIGDDKVMGISEMINRRSWEAIEAEIAKCDLVCANCHSTRTYLQSIGREHVSK